MSIVNEIARLTSAKAKIREAIAGKGVPVPAAVRMDGMAPLIAAIETGSGGGGNGSSAAADMEKILWEEILFIDYDGSVLYSYTVEEAQALTELPPLPSHDGLICQGWSYDLATIKEHNRELTVGAMYTTDDGKTRIYVHLEEERRSPILGCCPNGTVTIDWGDGSAVDTLTGTSLKTLVYSQTHTYSAGGDYVITLAVNGELGFAGATDTLGNGSGLLRFSSEKDDRNQAYQSSIQKIEIGNNVTTFYNCAFSRCHSLSVISIPNTVTTFSDSTFRQCYDLQSVVMAPGVTRAGQYMCEGCQGLRHVSIPNTVTTVASYAFQNCTSLSRVTLPNSLTDLYSYAFRYCYGIRSLIIPANVKQIQAYCFTQAYSLSRAIFLGSTKTFGNYVFQNCASLAYIDCTRHTLIPTGSFSGFMSGTPSDCKLLIPAALEEEWKTTDAWKACWDYIVGV